MNGIDESARFPSETRRVPGNVHSAVLVVSERHDQGTESIVRGQLLGESVGKQHVVRNPELTEEYPCPVGRETARPPLPARFVKMGSDDLSEIMIGT